MSTGSQAGVCAPGNAGVIHALLAELDALGVREFCVCAGARNAPLLEVLVRREGDITLRSFFEERSAAFFALGRVMQTQRPVAVITTSGTAVAELYPAVMEAYYQGLPLVVVTADRPSSYRGSGAPQAVEQPGLFGTYVVREVELEAGAAVQDTGAVSRIGPVHFNVCLEERLEVMDPVPAWLDASAATGEEEVQTWTEIQEHAWKSFWQADGDVLVLAAGIHPADVGVARDFLARLQAPVVAEATSNLQGDPALAPLLQRGGERTLRQMNAKRVLRLGAVPSWRYWRDLEQRTDVRVLNVSRAEFRGLAREEGVACVPWSVLKQQEALPQPAQSSITARAGDEAREKLNSLIGSYPHAEPVWMRHLSKAIGEKALVFISNSLPIREWNLAADELKSGTQVYANRGANGIDGIISTWLGLGAEIEESWLIVGDLSALYDLSAPWVLPQLREGKRRIVVINNGGGQIFSRLPWLNGAEEGTRKLMLNPHEIEFAAWAKMWGMGYRLVTDVGQLREGNGTGKDGCEVWEVRPDARQTEGFWKAWQG